MIDVTDVSIAAVHTLAPSIPKRQDWTSRHTLRLVPNTGIVLWSVIAGLSTTEHSLVTVKELKETKNNNVLKSKKLQLIVKGFVL